jgi:hypothetical protein
MRKSYLVVSFLLLSVSLKAQCGSALAFSDIYAGASGPAQSLIFMPQPASCYNGKMILFAHGYVPVGAPANF